MEMSLKYIMGKKIFKWMQVSGEYNFIILGAPKCHNPTVLGGVLDTRKFLTFYKTQKTVTNLCIASDQSIF